MGGISGNMSMKFRLAIMVVASIVCLGLARPGSAQRFGTSSAPRPSGRVSFFTNVSQTDVDGVASSGFGEFTTSITYRLPELDTDGLDYGLDFRHSGYISTAIPRRVSIYEGFVGGRMAGGAVRVRVGHMWLNDLGSLGSTAGAMVEVRQPSTKTSGIGRLRVGGFYGLEPNVLDTGYAADVKKFGGYLAFDGEHARRNVVGFVTIRDGSLTERSVLTTTNFVPVAQKFFLYQAAEYDLQAPAGQGQQGLSYFYTNARVSATSRVDVQGIYSRGRSIDTRSLTQDVLNGRPLGQSAIAGLLYESVGGRATVEVVRRVRVYAGYSRDKTNREDAATGRTLIGGYAGNILNSGFDVSASESLNEGPSRRYHSRYVSVGRQVGRSLYVSGDYSTSLSVIHFSRSDGILIEQRPQTTRVSGTGVLNLRRAISVLMTLDRTVDLQARELRLLVGMTYRFP